MMCPGIRATSYSGNARAIVGQYFVFAILAIGFLIPVRIAAQTAVDASPGATGLWVGSVQVVEASTLHAAATDPDPVPTGGVFSFPLIIHVGADGKPVLLKEVVLLPEGHKTRLFANPAGSRAVLSQAPAVDLRRARRIMSAAIDFAGSTLPMQGTFEPGETLTARLTLPPDHPTNPFAHRFHPDHDNLIDGDPRRRAYESDVEVYEIVREITLEFTDGLVTRDQLIGIYSERIEGLAAEPIEVRGRFRLKLITRTAELED